MKEKFKKKKTPKTYPLITPLPRQSHAAGLILTRSQLRKGPVRRRRGGGLSLTGPGPALDGAAAGRREREKAVASVLPAATWSRDGRPPGDATLDTPGCLQAARRGA